MYIYTLYSFSPVCSAIHTVNRKRCVDMHAILLTTQIMQTRYEIVNFSTTCRPSKGLCSVSVESITAGNVDRGNRKVMQIESSRELPNMIYGIRQNVNRQVSFHELYFFTVLQLYIYKKENTIPFSIYVCIRNE